MIIFCLDLNVPVILKSVGKGYFNLSCLSRGNPTPKYTWLADDIIVANNPKFTVELNTSYSVDYKCIVQNSAGTFTSLASGGLSCKILIISYKFRNNLL